MNNINHNMLICIHNVGNNSREPSAQCIHCIWLAYTIKLIQLYLHLIISIKRNKCLILIDSNKKRFLAVIEKNKQKKENREFLNFNVDCYSITVENIFPTFRVKFCNSALETVRIIAFRSHHIKIFMIKIVWTRILYKLLYEIGKNYKYMLDVIFLSIV